MKNTQNKKTEQEQKSKQQENNKLFKMIGKNTSAFFAFITINTVCWLFAFALLIRFLLYIA